MSATKTVIVLAALSAALFTSCKKSEYVTPDNRNLQSAKAGDNGNVSLVFKTGTMNISELVLRANQRTVGEVRPANLSLGDPILKMAFNMPAGNYDNLDITLKLVAGENAALHLNGLMSMNLIMDDGTDMSGNTRGVDFSINTPMNFTAKSGRISVGDNTSLAEVLGLSLDKLGGDIPNDLWINAFKQTKEGETIRISEQSNPGLYQMILKNLETILHPDITTHNPGPAAPAHILAVDRPTHAQ